MQKKKMIKLRNEWLFQEVPYKILINLRNQETQLRLSRDADTTFATTCILLSTFEEYGLIEKKRHGRDVTPILTKKGKELQTDILKIISNLGGKEDENTNR